MVILGILLLFVLVLYAYKNHNREFEATTSAIRQIWSGNCRLSCRPKQQSDLSDLEKRQGHGTESSFCMSSHQTNADRSECICSTCPCAFIEDVYRTCRPATNLYSQSIELISRGYCNVLRAFSDACNTAGPRMEHGLSCQRETQVLSIKQLGSADNINFINQTAVKAEGEKKETENQNKGVKFSRKKELEISQRTEASADNIINPTDSIQIETAPSTKKDQEFVQRHLNQREEIAFRTDTEQPKTVAVAQDINVQQSETTKYDTASVSSAETATSERKSCPKCISKGKICIGSCPTANANSNTND